MREKKESPVHFVKGRVSPSYIIDGKGLAVVDVCFPSDAAKILGLCQQWIQYLAQ